MWWGDRDAEGQEGNGTESRLRSRGGGDERGKILPPRLQKNLFINRRGEQAGYSQRSQKKKDEVERLFSGKKKNPDGERLQKKDKKTSPS